MTKPKDLDTLSSRQPVGHLGGSLEIAGSREMHTDYLIQDQKAAVLGCASSGC